MRLSILLIIILASSAALADGVAFRYTTDDGVVVRSSTFDEESYGEDLGQAKLDLLTSMVDHLEALESRESTLSPHDAAVLANLRHAVTMD